MHVNDSVSRIHAVVIDDEPLARANIRVLLERDPEVDLLVECESGEEGLNQIRSLKPDLVFLDIQMPECDGFEILEALGCEIPPAVILVTAFSQHATKAFDVEAVDFLLKPFDDARFARAVDRAKEKIHARRRNPLKNQILAVKNAGRVILLNTGEIEWIEAADYYSSLHVGAKTYLVRRSMNELDGDLDKRLFCRIHRSTIVNLRQVQEFAFGSDGGYEIVLKNGTKLRLSRRYRELLQARVREISSC